MQATEEILTSVAREVLETMAFIPASPGRMEGKGPGACSMATVAFSGSMNGSFALSVSPEALRMIADNMLVSDDGRPSTEAQAHDALGEIANVMCGNLLSRLAGPLPVFSLEAPVVESDVPDGAGNEGKNRDGITRAELDLVDGWARLELLLKTK